MVRGGYLIGSSPRAWGTALAHRPNHPNSRFIPTRVGNRLPVRPRVIVRSVHPHARGEQDFRQDHLAAFVGSSPRAWGTVDMRPCRGAGARFIPTRVGNRASPKLASSIRSVHPHARGEQVRSRRLALNSGGSSPRAWGTGALGQRRGQGMRFIPTRVGNSPSPLDSHALGTVHPHARGEQGHPEGGVGPHNGSSPRAWGTVPVEAGATFPDRFIPTRVGNSKIRPAFRAP